jgi:hypothetical protein
MVEWNKLSDYQLNGYHLLDLNHSNDKIIYINIKCQRSSFLTLSNHRMFTTKYLINKNPLNKDHYSLDKQIITKASNKFIWYMLDYCRYDSFGTLKRGNGHGLATHWGNHQTASPDRPSNGTHKAKVAEDDLETPGVETQSQNWKSRDTTLDLKDVSDILFEVGIPVITGSPRLKSSIKCHASSQWVNCTLKKTC